MDAIEKYNIGVASTFASDLRFFLIYFGTIAYLNHYLIEKTSVDNTLVALENSFLYYLFLIFSIYLFLSFFLKMSNWKHRLFSLLFGALMLIFWFHYRQVAYLDLGIFSTKFLLPYILIFIALFAIIQIAPLRRNLLDPFVPNMESFHQMYGGDGGSSGFLLSLYFVMIIYTIVFRQYNYNTPSSNAFQPLVLAPIILFSFFYFLAKFVIQIGMVKRFNMTNVMVSLYLIFSIFFCFYLYTFITSIQNLSTASPETAAAKVAEEKAFAEEAGFEKYIRKYIIPILLFAIVALYWIRDNIYWSRLSALGYLLLTLLLAYVSKVVVLSPNGASGTLTSLFFFEWLLITKLRWNSVVNVFNILFTGIEISNRDRETHPTMIS